jgi:hypothetical protein
MFMDLMSWIISSRLIVPVFRHTLSMYRLASPPHPPPRQTNRSGRGPPSPTVCGYTPSPGRPAVRGTGHARKSRFIFRLAPPTIKFRVASTNAARASTSCCNDAVFISSRKRSLALLRQSQAHRSRGQGPASVACHHALRDRQHEQRALGMGLERLGAHHSAQKPKCSSLSRLPGARARTALCAAPCPLSRWS